IGGTNLPNRGGPTTVSRPVAAVAAVGGRTVARFSTPVGLKPNASTTHAGPIGMGDLDPNSTMGVATALEGPRGSGTANQRINTNGRTMAVDAAGTTAYVLTTSGLSIIPIDRTVAADRPVLQPNGVVNTASFQNGIATGGLVSIFGRNLASSAQAPGFPLPTGLGGTCVTLNNNPLPLLATSDGQINAQLPTTLGAGRYQMVVRSIAKKSGSNTAPVTVAKYAPA